MAIDLRTYIILDSLQPQMASYISTISRGYFPLASQACCVIEIAPGIEINRLMDIALKSTNVTPGLQVVERSYGMMEIHSDSQGDTRTAGEAVLKALGKDVEASFKPKLLTSQLIKNMTDHHCQLINKTRYGNMVLRGDTLYVLEMEPAGYAYFAANEAEKTSKIKIIDVQGFGRFGRVYLAGDEAEVLESRKVVEARLGDLPGREIKGSGGDA